MGDKIVNLLFLRGQVPSDRNPCQIKFTDIDKCDDVWTQLAYYLSRDGQGEVWYWGGKRKVRYKDNFVERWVPNYKKHKSKFQPDVVFARGGFPQYDVVLKRYPEAFKIYYGAGKRFIPCSKFTDYDLILVDTDKQKKKVLSKFPKARVELFIKPSADNVFKAEKTLKEYDVIFSSNEHPSGIKGHNFILPIFPSDLKMVQVGIASKKLKRKYPNIHFTGWIPRKEIPNYYAKSRVAVVCCKSIDSCPRIIPEALSCGCPVLLLDTVNIWRDKYVTPQTGSISSATNFISSLRLMLKQVDGYRPYEYYMEHLSLEKAAQYIKDLIE